MPTYREQIVSIVDEGIRQGRIQSAMRDQYIQNLSADEGAAQFFATSLMQGRDYTHKTQELADQRRRLEQEQQAFQQRAQNDRAQLENWQQQVTAEVNRLRGLEAQYPEMTAKIAAYEQALNDYGIKDSVKVPQFQTPQYQPAQTHTTTGNHQQAQTNNAYLSREEGIGALREFMQMTAKAQQLSARHQHLFGQPLMDDLIGEALAAGVGPEGLEQYWSTKYNASAKQAEIDTARSNAEREALKAQLRSEILAEVATDPTRHFAPGYQAPPSPIAQYMRPGAMPNQSAAVDPNAPRTPESVGQVQAHASSVQQALAEWRSNYTPDGMPLAGGGPAQAPFHV